MLKCPHCITTRKTIQLNLLYGMVQHVQRSHDAHALVGGEGKTAVVPCAHNARVLAALI